MADIEKATVADVPALSQTLARAFYDDPAISWMVPDDARRLRVGPYGFKSWLTKIYLPKNQVFTDPDRKAAALWAPPGKWRMSAGLQLRLTPSVLRIVGLKRLPLIAKGLAMMDKQHPDDRPHWYLAVLGTDPDYQGKGLGSAVMQPVLDRCDADGVGAYLESSKEANIPFYRRHGFEVTGEIVLPDGPPIWPMWRDPQPPS
ncbi:MAG: GNAT family N-acetyltransferase [Acidimicrobiia bacterium]|nr:GNAT family N-acetyltransferase [Acidimicrobiia bacterium]